MVNTMEKKRTRTPITEELYKNAKPIVDLFGIRTVEFKTKTEFYEAGAAFVARYIGNNISPSTFVRMLRSADYENYIEISKKANPHKKKAEVAETAAEESEPYESLTAPAGKLVITQDACIDESGKTIDDIWKQLYVEPSDFASTIGEQIVCISKAVSCTKKDIVKEIKESNATNAAFLEDLSKAMFDIRDSIREMVTELSRIRISNERLLKEWRGESIEDESEDANK